MENLQAYIDEATALVDAELPQHPDPDILKVADQTEQALLEVLMNVEPDSEPGS